MGVYYMLRLANAFDCLFGNKQDFHHQNNYKND